MFKKEKKVKIIDRKSEKIKSEKSLKEKISGLFFTVISLVCAMTLFIGLVFLQNYFTEDITYEEIIVSIKTIPEGEIITKSNFDTYFGAQNINILTLNEGVLKREDSEKLLNKKAKVTLYQGEIITLKDFKDLNVYTDYIEDPIEISIAADSMASSDGGKIRAGDLVNITLMFTGEQLSENKTPNTGLQLTPSIDLNLSGITTDNTIKEEGKITSSVYNFETFSQYVLENIYVSKVLAADGSVIKPTDQNSTAAIFVFVIPKKMELDLNNALENCSSMRVSKLLYSYTPENTEEIE